jgi:hypothetical protein
MSETELEIGPVDFIIIEWPPGAQLTGEGLAEIVNLTERGIVRVLDLAFVKKEEDGSVIGIAITDLDQDGSLDLVQFEGASSGLMNQDDYDEAGAALEPGAAAAIIVYENTWAAPFVSAVRRSGGEAVAGGRIPVSDLLEALDALDA